KITPSAIMAVVAGTLAIAALTTNLTAADANKSGTTTGTGVNDVGYDSQAPAIRPTGNTPQYQIFDIGVVDVGDSFSQGFGVAPTAGIAVGRSVRNDGSQAFNWTVSGGIVSLPNLAGRSFCVSNGANDSGVVVGTGSTTVFGSSRLPVIWQN